MRKRPWIPAAGLLAVIFALTWLLATNQGRNVETYTLTPGHVIIARRSEVDRLVYSVIGGSTDVVVDNIVGGGSVNVGDMIFTVDGHSSWAFGAYAHGQDCWYASGASRLDGDFIDINTGGLVTRPGVEIHVRIPKSPSFDAAIDPDGHIVVPVICIGHDGLAVSGG